MERGKGQEQLERDVSSRAFADELVQIQRVIPHADDCCCLGCASFGMKVTRKWLPRIGIRRSHGMGIILVPIMIYTFAQKLDGFGFI